MSAMLVTASQVREAKVEEDEAIAEALAAASGGSADQNFKALSAEQKIEIIRTLVTQEGPVPPTPVAKASELSLRSRLIGPSSPFHVFWWVPLLLQVSNHLPVPELAALAPTAAWAAAAAIGLDGFKTEFHLRVAAAWQALLAWPWIEAISNGLSAGQGFAEIVETVGPVGLSATAATATVLAGTILWDFLSD